MNQVYFYCEAVNDISGIHRSRLNPFMNQVYFYRSLWLPHQRYLLGLNPFMNQVYFYYN